MKTLKQPVYSMIINLENFILEMNYNIYNYYVQIYDIEYLVDFVV